MRDYVRSEASARDSVFAFPKLRRLLRNWFARRYLRKLEEFDDDMLQDIGLTRGDLAHGQSQSWDVDPFAEIIRSRERRRRSADLPQ